MPVGLSDGTGYKDNTEWLDSSNPTEGLQRVYIDGIDASTGPVGGSTEPTGALKLTEGTQTPAEGEKVRFTTASPLINITDSDIDNAINIGMGAGPGTMMGVTSKTFGKAALAQAQHMESIGAHPEDIWSVTGNYKGVDGRWRQEISDNAAKIKPGSKEFLEQGGVFNNDTRVAHILDHRELYDAYPWTQNIKTKLVPELGNGASYDELTNTIKLGPKAVTEETVLHEVQHAIQSREGFAKGGAEAKQFALRYEDEVSALKKEGAGLLKTSEKGPLSDTQSERAQYIAKVLTKDWERRAEAPKRAFENYQRLAGEVEARNTETRLLLDSMQRRKFFPEWTQDTKNANQIVVDKPAWTTPYGATYNPLKAPQYSHDAHVSWRNNGS